MINCIITTRRKFVIRFKRTNMRSATSEVPKSNIGKTILLQHSEKQFPER